MKSRARNRPLRLVEIRKDPTCMISEENLPSNHEYANYNERTTWRESNFHVIERLLNLACLHMLGVIHVTMIINGTFPSPLR